MMWDEIKKWYKRTSIRGVILWDTATTNIGGVEDRVLWRLQRTTRSWWSGEDCDVFVDCPWSWHNSRDGHKDGTIWCRLVEIGLTGVWSSGKPQVSPSPWCTGSSERCYFSFARFKSCNQQMSEMATAHRRICMRNEISEWVHQWQWNQNKKWTDWSVTLSFHIMLDCTHPGLMAMEEGWKDWEEHQRRVWNWALGWGAV
jgi:hypothetical protein